MFGSLIPGGGPGAQGLSLLKQLSSMGGQPGASPVPGVAPPVAQPGWAGDTPNAINNGFMAKMMSGNPGGLIGALMKSRNAPVNPGAPPPPGSPAYVPGGAGPAMPGGAPPQVGLLQRMFPQMAAGGAGMGQFGGASGAPRFMPGDIAGS